MWLATGRDVGWVAEATFRVAGGSRCVVGVLGRGVVVAECRGIVLGAVVWA
jgi:hypothetical protein